MMEESVGESPFAMPKKTISERVILLREWSDGMEGEKW